jgi:hypothetical protein
MSELVEQLQSIELGAETEEDFGKKIDLLQMVMLSQCDLVDDDVINRFADGMYVRECRVPAGTVWVSKIHKTQHPFVILKGDVSVFTPRDGVVRFKAGHVGITEPGTRRVLVVHEDLAWATFHTCKNGETVDEIEERIIEKRLLPGGVDTYLEWKKKVHESEVANELGTGRISGNRGDCRAQEQEG